MDKSNQKVFALKYRPKNFKELIGQDIMVQTIVNSIKSNNTQISNIIYEYNITVPQDITISYEGLYNITKILYPFILINEQPFNKDDKIEYYDIERKNWIKGTILKYSNTNTYNIALYDTRFEAVIDT